MKNKLLNSKITLLLLLMIVLCLFITCSDNNPTEPNGGGTNGVIIFTPSASTGQAISWIELSGLPNDSKNYAGIVTPLTSTFSASAVDDTGYTYVRRTDSGDFMIMPLYPPDPIHGGVVQIILTDGEGNVSEPMEFTIDSLPEAPNEYSDVVALMQDVLTMNLALNGLTRDSLDFDSASDIPLTLLPYYLSYNVIDNPENSNSMRAIADGPIPYLNNNSIDIELLDRLYGLMDIRAYYEDIIANLDTTSSQVSLYNNSKLSNISINSSQTCITPPSYGITTCAQLAAAMSDQAKRAKASASASEKVVNDIISSTLLGISLIPGAAPISATIGGALWTNSLMNSGFENMLPSEFVDEATSFNPSITEFNEDYTEPGNWTEFKVTATSNGWKLDKITLEGVLQAVGALGAGEGISAVPTVFSKNATSVMKGFFEGQAQKAAIDKLTQGEDFVQVCPNTWSNINCADEDYSTTTVLSGNIVIDETARTYEPFEVGQATFKIETSDAFDEDLTGIATSINTKAIEIFIDPYQAEADTNETVYFTARVENAENTTIEFTNENGGSLFSTGLNAAITTPGSPWDPPIILKARSLSTTGLRATALDERTDEAPIYYTGDGTAYISPASKCLKPSESNDFTVVLSAGNIDSVKWETVPQGIGSIIGSGETITYTAPSTHEGQIQLKATVNGTRVAYAELDISDCICQWNLEASGNGHSYSVSGNWSTITRGPDSQLFLQQSKDSSISPVYFVIYQLTGIGNFQVGGSFYSPDDLDWNTLETQSLPIAQITAYVEDEYVEGVITGELNHLVSSWPDDVYETITFSVSFHADFFNLERPQCSPDSL